MKIFLFFLHGFRYPTITGSFRWLVYKCFIAKPKSKRGVISGFRKQKYHIGVLVHNTRIRIKIYITKHIGLETLFKRSSYQDLKALKKPNVLVLGCGTIGSKVADNLVMAGVLNIAIADEDTLQAGNICRHVLGIDSLNMPKVEAMKKHLLVKNPFLNIKAINKNIIFCREYYSSVISQADIVISCIGRDSVEAWINDCAMYHGKPVMFCRSYAKATLGELFLARKGKCCFRCASAFLQSESCSIPRPPAFDYSKAIGYDTDCGVVFIPGSVLDIDFVALNCTKIAIEYLVQNNLDSDYWLIRGRAIKEDVGWNPPEELNEEYTVLDFKLNVETKCPVCDN